MIFISHRGISLILFLFIFTSILFGIIKREKIWKFYLFSIFLAFILSLIYFLPSFLDQISILSDSIRLSLSSLFSYNRIVGGRSLISDSGNINPFVDYLFSQTYIILFGFIGILVYLKNKKAKNIHLIILILFLHINNKYIKIMSVFLISILLIISSVQLSELKRPYFNSNFGGEEFIDNDIPTNNSLIIAPDYIQTMLMQKGFEPPIRNDILNGIHLLGLQKSDDFLLTGFNNLSLIEDQRLCNKEVYVMFTIWDLNHKLPRATINNNGINLINWDKSPYYDKVYSGDKDIIRIYKLKNESRIYC